MVRASGNVLVRVEMDRGAGLAALTSGIAAAGTTFALEPLFEVPARPSAGTGVAAAPRAVWHRARATGLAAGSPWDAAREVGRQAAAQAEAQGARVTHVEPDLIQEWPTQPSPLAALGVAHGFADQDGSGGKAVGPRIFAWHLGDGFSGLASARQHARDNKSADIRIAHLDVGYGLDHKVFPRERFEPLLSRNCTGDGRPEHDVNDLVKPGTLKNPGHGTGTIGLLAGGRFAFDPFHQSDYQPFDDQIGAAPDARIVGVRVADSVVQIHTSAVARAIAYVAELCNNEETRVHVLSMSMGGVASQAWADAVNLAYLRGVVIVTAAGNNLATGFGGGIPTTSTVYPARFERVLSACGVMADSKPYYGLARGTMQGNWGIQSAITPR